MGKEAGCALLSNSLLVQCIWRCVQLWSIPDFLHVLSRPCTLPRRSTIASCEQGCPSDPSVVTCCACWSRGELAPAGCVNTIGGRAFSIMFCMMSWCIWAFCISIISTISGKRSPQGRKQELYQQLTSSRGVPVRSALQHTDWSLQPRQSSWKGQVKNISIICLGSAKLLSMNKTIHTSFSVSPPFYSKAAVEHLLVSLQAHPSGYADWQAGEGLSTRAFSLTPAWTGSLQCSPLLQLKIIAFHVRGFLNFMWYCSATLRVHCMCIKSTYHDLWVLISSLCSGTTLLGREGRRERAKKPRKKQKSRQLSFFFFLTGHTKSNLHISASEKSCMNWDCFVYENKQTHRWRKSWEILQYCDWGFLCGMKKSLAEDWAREIIPGFCSCIISQ